LISNSDSSRMGKAVEHLVAATCIIESRARLNVSTALVDDEGVDLVFHRRGGSATLAVQVKARMSDSKQLAAGTFRANVRTVSLKPRVDLYVLFVAVDVPSGTFDICWFVPSSDLAAKARVDAIQRHVFVASAKTASRDQWSQYRLTRSQLPNWILNQLNDREVTL
jgi:hypothetical protein